MTFEAALTQELEAITDIKNKVFPLQADQKADAPYLVFVSSEGKPYKSLDGFLELKEVSCELNVLNKRYRSMKNLAKEVITKIEGFEGREIGTGGPYIYEVTYEEPVELWENDPKLYRCIINANFTIRR